MATGLYIVILSQGKWWIDFEGTAHGPYESRERAALEAKQLAQFAAHMSRPSEVLVPDENGKYWVVWNSREENAGIARSLDNPSRTAA